VTREVNVCAHFHRRLTMVDRQRMTFSGLEEENILWFRDRFYLRRWYKVELNRIKCINIIKKYL